MLQTVNQNHPMYQFFTQIPKEIQFKSKHQLYPWNKSQGISNCFINKNQAINYVKLSQIIKCILESQKISKNHSTN
jgi:hypothetical protein